MHVMLGLIEHNHGVVLCYGGSKANQLKKTISLLHTIWRWFCWKKWEASTFLYNIILSLIQHTSPPVNEGTNVVGLRVMISNIYGDESGEDINLNAMMFKTWPS